MRTSVPLALCSKGLPWAVPGNPHHIAAEGGEDHVGLLCNCQTVVDAAHRQHADRASGAVNQFDIRGQNAVFEAEAIDGVGVAAAETSMMR